MVKLLLDLFELLENGFEARLVPFIMVFDAF